MESAFDQSVTRWLQTRHPVWFTIFTAGSAFCLYTCVYAFRKTFAATTFEGMAFYGIDYKSLLVISQILGYALSKFIGIKVISELTANSRAGGILVMISIAGISWLLFALVPAPYNIIFLFTNGLPLGMVWGMVFSYLEGRRTTEVLGAALSVSFIFSSGLCRSTGAYLIRDWNVSEMWMPFVACCIFLLPLLLFLYLLDRVPPPSPLDEQQRTKRMPMNSAERKKFIATFLPGIVLFVLCYIFLTIYRDFRDNFSAEVWNILGYGNSPEIFTTTEIPVSFIVLIIMGSIMFIKNNALALLVNHLLIGAGMLLIGLATFLFELHILDGPQWMILIGLGLYMGYVPFNSIFFDRLIATFRYTGTVGFIMYVADSFGYLGSVSIVLFKEFGYRNLSWLSVFINAGYVISVGGTLLIVGSMFYFHLKSKEVKPKPGIPAIAIQ